MKKIISLFERDWNGDKSLVVNKVTIGAEWVVDGEGIATEKIDGTACMVHDGKLYKRYDAKNGKTPPLDFVPAQEPDSITGHWPGWIPVTNKPDEKWHLEAWGKDDGFPDGTYELIGPKIGGNPYDLSAHYLVPHGRREFPDAPRDYDGLREWLSQVPIEGLVWHHPDGRMVKIKRRDFGIDWK